MSKSKEEAVLNKIYHSDARKINTIIKRKMVDVVITSPPYFDLKDYGSEDQIGYGQDYKTYLNDLKKLFSKVFKVTKDDGSLWVIIDVFRKDGELLLLPFDFANKLKEVGWKLQDIIIWSKDKTVPWVHDGQMRNLFEYVLVFSKQSNFKFYIDRVRDWENLKKWWVKYPERYNPKGKVPSGIWEFGIPTQGAWGNGYIRHFCPLPEGLVENIIKLTTNEGDVVLDPFAGTGTVLSKAEQMKRSFIGTELNSEYISMFENYRTKQLESNSKTVTQSLSQNEFESTILNLRLLKYAKTLLVKVTKNFPNLVLSVFVPSDFKSVRGNHKVISSVFHFFICGGEFDHNEVRTFLHQEASRAPLSKFGIEPNINIGSSFEDFTSLLANKEVFEYSLKNTHNSNKKIAIAVKPSEFANKILSDIHLQINEEDYNN